LLKACCAVTAATPAALLLKGRKRSVRIKIALIPTVNESFDLRSSGVVAEIICGALVLNLECTVEVKGEFEAKRFKAKKEGRDQPFNGNREPDRC